MNTRTRNLFTHITKTLQADPSIPIHQPIQAALLTAKKMGFTQAEAKWVVEMLRVELGVHEKEWYTLVAGCLKTISSGEDAPPLLII